MRYKRQLQNAINYALEEESYNKEKWAENVDIVCAWGTGRFFSEAFEQWKFQSRLRVNLLCDSNKDKWGTTIHDMTCVSPEELYQLSKHQKVLVITFVGNPVELNTWLKEHHIRYTNAAECVFEYLCDTPKEKEWFEGNRLLEVLNEIKDDESRHVYTNVLCNRLAPHLSEADYNELYSIGEYFETGVFALGEHESYVDCGAYTGDTIEKFLRVVNGKFSHIYGFEMEPINYSKLCATLKKCESKHDFTADDYELFQNGVWSQEEWLSFGKEDCGSDEGYCLFKTEHEQSVKVVAMDDVIDGSVSFIKMDIEGSEIQALKGAARIIKDNKPKLAICLYHRLEDFWVIPEYIKKLVPEYQIYVRHHQNGTMGGTVMYATCESI